MNIHQMTDLQLADKLALACGYLRSGGSSPRWFIGIEVFSLHPFCYGDIVALEKSLPRKWSWKMIERRKDKPQWRATLCRENFNGTQSEIVGLWSESEWRSRAIASLLCNRQMMIGICVSDTFERAFCGLFQHQGEAMRLIHEHTISKWSRSLPTLKRQLSYESACSRLREWGYRLVDGVESSAQFVNVKRASEALKKLEAAEVRAWRGLADACETVGGDAQGAGRKLVEAYRKTDASGALERDGGGR